MIEALGIGALCLLVHCLLAIPGDGTGLMRSLLILAELLSVLKAVLPVLPLSPDFCLLKFVHNLEASDVSICPVRSQFPSSPP